MRILFLIPNMGLGGAQRVMSHIVNYASASGHCVGLGVLSAPDVLDFFPVNPNVNRFHLDRLGGTGVVRLYRVLSRFWRLRQLKGAFCPDIIVSFMDTMNIASIAAFACSRVPILVAERSDPASSGINPIYRRIRDASYRYANAVIVQTKSIAEYFERQGTSVTVIPNPVLSAEGAANPAYPGADGRMRIVAVGRLSVEKRFSILIDAFARLAEQYTNWDVHLVGDGPERAAIEAQIGSLNLFDRIILHGSVSSAHKHLQAGHIFVLPSDYEGFPNALAEAMAAGLPAIACRGVSGVSELIIEGRTGILVDRNLSENSLAEALEALMLDPSRRSTMGEAARTHVQQWLPSRILAQWEQLITDTVRKADSSRLGASS